MQEETQVALNRGVLPERKHAQGNAGEVKQLGLRKNVSLNKTGSRKRQISL